MAQECRSHALVQRPFLLFDLCSKKLEEEILDPFCATSVDGFVNQFLLPFWKLAGRRSPTVVKDSSMQALCCTCDLSNVWFAKSTLQLAEEEGLACSRG
jgi:hypothetical protein